MNGIVKLKNYNLNPISEIKHYRSITLFHREEYMVCVPSYMWILCPVRELFLTEDLLSFIRKAAASVFV